MPSTNTSFKFSKQELTAINSDAIIIPVYKIKQTGKKSSKKFSLPKEFDSLNKAASGMLSVLATEEKFDASSGKTLTYRITSNDKLSVKRILIVGLGDAEKAHYDTFFNAIKRTTSSLITLDGFSNIAIYVPKTNEKLDEKTLVMAGIDAVYETTYKSDEAKDKPPKLNSITFNMDKAVSSDLKNYAKTAALIAGGRSTVRDLVNKPPNLKTTNVMASKATAIGKTAGIKTSIQKNVSWIEKNMPCFFAVARGSLKSDPPKFIHLHYKPKNPKKTITLVGKSVMFDTGGYQVKTGAYMNTMKGDMTGGATVIGAFEALAKLKPEHLEIHGYLAATPNMIDGNAMVPDSIVDTTCGKKVEIRHTDAEGRLTLIDAVSMAAKDKPDELITIATLTGSASLAVGCSIALMGNDDALESRILEAAHASGDPVQPLKVRDDDYNCIKSKLDAADLRNTSTIRERGAQTAAAFVMSGAPNGLKMAHLDIAGADMTPDEKATGIGVKTILTYLLEQNKIASKTKKTSTKKKK